jgi:small subunit ribosomal protein S6
LKIIRGIGVAKKKQVKKITEDKRLHDYELVYIVNPDVAEDALEAQVNSISQFITNRDGVIESVDKWGKKKLAYPLKHYLEGNYILTKFRISPARLKEIEANLKISEEVLRHLLVKAGT